MKAVTFSKFFRDYTKEQLFEAKDLAIHFKVLRAYCDFVSQPFNIDNIPELFETFSIVEKPSYIRINFKEGEYVSYSRCRKKMGTKKGYLYTSQRYPDTLEEFIQILSYAEIELNYKKTICELWKKIYTD